MMRIQACVVFGVLGAACLPGAGPGSPQPQSHVDAGTTMTPQDGGMTGGDAGPATLHVLFIGNSYTYVNDLPGMLQRISETAGVPPNILTQQVTVGGATLATHWVGPDAQARILERTWTHVVLQGQSLEPVYEPEAFEPYAALFGDLIVDAGAQPTWYVTWARGAIPDAGYAFPGGPEEMQDRLTKEYGKVARPFAQSLMACVGDAFGASLREHPEIVLHQEDLSHPTVAGTYLAACTFYTALTGRPVPETAAIPAGVTSENAALLRSAARVGSNCLDRRLRANVRMAPCPGCPAGGSFSFGTAGVRLSNVFWVSNNGESATDIADGLTLAAPLEWSGDAGYPGGSGALNVGGVELQWCGSRLEVDAGCALSVDFTGAATGNAMLTVAASNVYAPLRPRMFLAGTGTTRAFLTVSEEDGFYGCTDEGPCFRPARFFPDGGAPLEVGLVVTNRGALTATFSEGAPLAAPWYWGGDGGFPGGTAGVVVEDTQYPSCTGTLEPGAQCGLTLGVVPVAGTPLFSQVELAYSDVMGPVMPNVTRRLMCYQQ